MKKIRDGMTYNTDTATLVAEARWQDDDRIERNGKLYQTLGGAFFLHTTWIQDVWLERRGVWEQRERDEVEPMSAERAQEWMLEGEVEVFNNPFGDPPEAEAEAEPSTTIYIRVPPALKQRVESAAVDAKLSVNAWVIKCLEVGLTNPLVHLGPVPDHVRNRAARNAVVEGSVAERAAAGIAPIRRRV
jgi:hypothetical protein